MIMGQLGLSGHAGHQNHQFSPVTGQWVLGAGPVPDLMPVRQTARAVLLTFVGQSDAQRRAARHSTNIYVKMHPWLCLLALQHTSWDSPGLQGSNRCPSPANAMVPV
jgi:hypothetical protein